MKAVTTKRLHKVSRTQVDGDDMVDERVARLLALAGVCTGGPPDLADRHNELAGLRVRKLF